VYPEGRPPGVEFSPSVRAAKDARSLQAAAHDADKIVDADDVALRAAAVREHRRIAGLGIAALGTGAVDVNVTVVASAGALRIRI